ncbi:hypothetical protein PENSPDRAFT_689750 [Peniophora sp. CONT]|nr:hypothetical protein PENSPDRAFT_689750 [Peniophora sp. CONT]
MVFEGKVSMLDISQIDKAWKFGHTMDPFAKDWKAILPAVKIPPQETVRVTTTIMRGRLEVPFTVTLRSKANGFEVRTYGIWSGISTWDLRRTVVTRHGLESRQIAV